jgi:hypothetical protein
MKSAPATFLLASLLLLDPAVAVRVAFLDPFTPRGVDVMKTVLLQKRIGNRAQ